MQDFLMRNYNYLFLIVIVFYNIFPKKIINIFKVISDLMISILYFKNENYLTQTDIFQEIRKNISKYFKVKTSDIRLKFGEGDPLQRITDISRDNNLKNKKR